MCLLQEDVAVQEILVKVMACSIKDRLAAIVEAFLCDQLAPVVVSLWRPTSHIHLMISGAVHSMPPNLAFGLRPIQCLMELLVLSLVLFPGFYIDQDIFGPTCFQRNGVHDFKLRTCCCI